MLAAVTEAGHACGAPQASLSTLSGTCWHPSASQRDELPGFAALTCTLGEVAHPSLQPGLFRGSRGPAWLPTAAVDGGGQPPPSPARLDDGVVDYREGRWWASTYDPHQNVLGVPVSFSL